VEMNPCRIQHQEYHILNIERMEEDGCVEALRAYGIDILVAQCPSSGVHDIDILDIGRLKHSAWI
jgi:hypothetical protein